MKKAFPWIVTALCLAWVLAALRPPSEKSGFRTGEFGALPVQLNGRVQPLDTVARNSLLAMRGRQSVAAHGQPTLSASAWLLEVMTRPDEADQRKVFRVDFSELQDLLGLTNAAKYYSAAEIEPGIERLEKEAARISAAERSRGSERAPLSAYEKQVLKLYQGLILYRRLQLTLQPPGARDFEAELKTHRASIRQGLEAVHSREANQPYDTNAFQQILVTLSGFSRMGQSAYPLVVPPSQGGLTNGAWTSMGSNLMALARSDELPPVVEHYARMAGASARQDAAAFNQAVADCRQWLAAHGFGRELKKSAQEHAFNRYGPFSTAISLYVLAFLIAVVSWLAWSDWLAKTAFSVTTLAWVIHTAGLVVRMMIEGRPPVTNLYSSAVFIGWGAAGLGLVLERIYRDGIGSVIGSVVGFLTLLVAHYLSLDGDTIQLLRAVLNTNFWLATHVITIALGYSATFVAGFLGMLYVLRGFFLKTLVPEKAAELGRMIYGITCFALLFNFVGTVLGGIWADQSWGRFWGWDPKENGALILVLWNSIVLHARRDGMLRDRGVALAAVFGNVVTAFSWFGVNMLGVGLHSYGFIDQAFLWLMAFIVSQLMIIGLGLAPLRQWASFRSVEPAAGGSSENTG